MPGCLNINLMVEYRLDTTFRALADPTRRGMLANLALGDKSIGERAKCHIESILNHVV